MNEDNAFQPNEHQIRFPRQLSGVKSVSETESVNDAADRKLRLRVLPSDTAHPFAPLLR